MRTVLPGERHELCSLCTYALLAHEKADIGRIWESVEESAGG
jgi:hypothetical protein